MTHTDHDFPQALADFTAAAEALLAPRTVTTIHGHVTTLPSVVDQIAEGKVQAPADDAATGSSFESKPPVWLGKVDWEARVLKALRPLVTDRRRVWLSPTMGLRWALAQTFSPAQAKDLARAAAELDATRWEGLRILHPILFMVTAPCPECGKDTVTRHTDDGPATVSALMVRDLWSECGACEAQWWGADTITVLASDIKAKQLESAEDVLRSVGEAARQVTEALDQLPQK